MAYTISLTLDLGEDFAGLTLRAQLRSAGADVGAAVTTGFYEEPGGVGIYEWVGSIPNGFRGMVVFANVATSEKLIAVSINPQEVEIIDANIMEVHDNEDAAAGLEVLCNYFADDTNHIGDNFFTFFGNNNVNSGVTLDSLVSAESPASLNALADHVLRRTMVNVKASADGDAISKGSLYGFIQTAQKSATLANTLTVQNPDGSTLGTFTLSVDVNGLVTGIT